MKCPQCHNNSSRVVDSRPTDDGHAIRRRRECTNCNYRFTTFERIDATPLMVLKKNGTREEFCRKKLRQGLLRSTEKRPVSMDQIEELVDAIEARLQSVGSNEISSQLIGEYVMDLLVKVDEISYIRFASVYRSFKDMSVFQAELEELMKRSHQ